LFAILSELVYINVFTLILEIEGPQKSIRK
jgi:hypothetical protein